MNIESEQLLSVIWPNFEEGHKYDVIVVMLSTYHNNKIDIQTLKTRLAHVLLPGCAFG